MLWIAILLTINFPASFGQLPKECTLDKLVFDFECCPTTSSGECGGPTRGSCVNISIVDQCADNTNTNSKYCELQQFMRSRPSTNLVDFRLDWPTQIFRRVCQCEDNYGGYDCMRCKRGFTGDDCSDVAEPVVRRNILSMTDGERQEFVNTIKTIKSETSSGFVVPIKEPVTTDPTESFVEISLFNIFATFHFNTIRDQDISSCSFCTGNQDCQVPDFGHEGPAFLTWHRAYMLYVETEIQRVTDDVTFGLPYWDWTDEKQRDKIWDLMGESNCGRFSVAQNNDSKPAPIDGPFSDWDAICGNPVEIICNVDNQMCNPTQNPVKIERCIGGRGGFQCRVESTLPTTREVTEALKETEYDVRPYGKGESNRGFRNALEGFRFLVERNRKSCDLNTEDFAITELHNRVHLYTGGTMLNVATASNDPLFFLHHCMIDRLYELWLDNFSDDELPSYEPSTFKYEIAPGHNIDDYLVPLFPLYTSRYMHQRAKNFGYTYNVPDSAYNLHAMSGVTVMFGFLTLLFQYIY